jgi:hypothetical protein
MRGLVVSWRRRVASAAAVVSGISTPAMISLIICVLSGVGVLGM